MNNLDIYYIALIIRTIMRGKASKASTEEELLAITEASGAFGIREGASQEEIEATKNYILCIVKLQEKGRYSEGEQQWLIAKAKKYRKAIIKARKEYDNAGKYISDTVAKANEVFDNLKSPKYITDKKKRKSIFKSSYYGIDDPFYDSFKKIYGDEGLLGY